MFTKKNKVLTFKIYFMIKIKKDFIKIGEEKTSEMMSNLTELANRVCELDDETFSNILYDCDIEEDELNAILDGNVRDMSLYEYHMIFAYMDNLLKSTTPKVKIPTLEDIDIKDNTEEYHNYKDDKKSYATVDNKAKSQQVDVDCEDEFSKFIDKVNAALDKKYQINKDDALKAKEQFDKDLGKTVTSDYDKAAKESNIELFGTERDLNTMTMDELKYLIYKNNWDKEFDLNMINHRQTVLTFLYHKLEKKVTEKIHKKNNINQKSFDDIKKNYNEKYGKQYEVDALKLIFGLLKDINKTLK